MKQRKRRIAALLIAVVSAIAGLLFEYTNQQQSPQTLGVVSSTNVPETRMASAVLDTLEVKGRAPKTGYERSQFSSGWGSVNSCSVRELILQRDLQNTTVDEDGCKVLSGQLNVDPYSNSIIDFTRGITTSQAVQIDHVVAVSDAWQKGAQQLTKDLRYEFYNDPLNLLAVDGDTNNEKGDGDAATWLPPNRAYRCQYVARQIAVKQKYTLWVTEAEKAAMKRVLSDCPDQQLPVVSV